MSSFIGKALSMTIIVISITGMLTAQKDIFEDERALANWYGVKIYNTSPDGTWYEIIKDYELTDSIEVRSVDHAESYSLGAIKKRRFMGQSYWYLQEGKVHRLDLDQGNVDIFEDYDGYTLIPQQEAVILEPKKDSGSLVLYRQATAERIPLGDQEGFRVNGDGTYLVGVEKKGEITKVKITKLIGRPEAKTWFTFNWGEEIEELIWSPDGRCIAFRIIKDEQRGENTLGYINLRTGKKRFFEPGDYPGFCRSHQIKRGPTSYQKFIFSPDGENIFFASMPKERKKVIWDDTVEIYRGRDEIDYISPRMRTGYFNVPLYHMWNPGKQTYMQLTDSLWRYSLFSGDFTKVVLFKEHIDAPNTKWVPDRDLKVLDLQTGKYTWTIEGATYSNREIDVSKGGGYMHYFKDLHWKVYHLRTGREIDISALFKHPLYDNTYSRPGNPPPFGIAGYSSDERFIYLYDRYDLWQIDLLTFEKERLTRGRKQGITYRIVKAVNSGLLKEKYSGDFSPIIDTSKPLYLEMKDDRYDSGFAVLDHGKVKKIAFEAAYLSNPVFLQDNFLYLQEDYDLPPRVMWWENKSRDRNILFQSNSGYMDYDWGKVELIYCPDSRGKRVCGGLMYPIGYDGNRKYPMVVKVYEQQAGLIHRFNIPSLIRDTGINISYLRSHGYFVFLPNLEYEIGDVGVSANASLDRALDRVLENTTIDPHRLGLFGYSFGGYETNFVITHDHRFSAAVSGAGVSDIIRHYLTPSPSGSSKYFQFEDYQMRMGKPYYEIKDAYLRNSPILDVDRITTPLLLFAGKQDHHVDWNQSLMFHMALKRAQKESVLLLYPEASHVLVDPFTKKDIMARVGQWFDHYLKGAVKPKWMQADTYEFK